ncbi:MAG TPA: hypothetical protein VEM76_06575 [Anaeromyxobacteraceae bacterium]|nr:hypothetical protein [Anaeromyxobacteraceae bacterium]
MREGRVSYEKARIVAGAATEKTLARWLARAEEATCVELRRQAQAEEKTQMCERGELRVRVPGWMRRGTSPRPTPAPKMRRGTSPRPTPAPK